MRFLTPGFWTKWFFFGRWILTVIQGYDQKWFLKDMKQPSKRYWILKLDIVLKLKNQKKTKLTDTGFLDFLRYWMYQFFDLGYWIRLIKYQSTSDVKVYPQRNVNKSTIALF